MTLPINPISPLNPATRNLSISRMEHHLDELVDRYPSLQVCRQDIQSAYEMLVDMYWNDGKLLVAGNGGSAADAAHIVGELMKEFKIKRKVFFHQRARLTAIDPEMGDYLAENLQGTLPAISLIGEPSLVTAYMNDSVPALVFAQQINGLGQKGDSFLAISTSGSSKNIIYAAIVAKSLGLKVIGLTGERHSRLSELADICIQVPETETFKIQELHLPVYHCLCMMLEEYFFGLSNTPSLT